MPPRLLSDPDVTGPNGDQARSYGFVDTVHGASGSGSVWTSNKFCNQWAAMPSLHFGYSLLIGLTIMTLPLSDKQTRILSKFALLDAMALRLVRRTIPVHYFFRRHRYRQSLHP